MSNSSNRRPAAVTPPEEFPSRGRILGIDYGQKRVGLALSNLDQTLATPHETIVRRDAQQDARRLQQIVREYSVVGSIVGLPVHMSGDEGEKAREARAYGAWVASVTKLPVRFHDERYTTALADEILREFDLGPKQRKARRDQLAAQILLQSYLDGNRQNDAPGAV